MVAINYSIPCPIPSWSKVLTVQIGALRDYSMPSLHPTEFFKWLPQVHSLVVVGDFNYPGIFWVSLTGSYTPFNLFCAYLFNKNLTQLVLSPTHIKGSILDLVLTNKDNRIYYVLLHSQDLPFPADHFLVPLRIALLKIILVVMTPR